MLYPKNRERFSDDLFKNPTSEYRATPFWAWNSSLDKDELTRQIEIFKKMGYGGFHMHVRAGMDTVYLSDEFFSLAGVCVDKAKELGMLAWLYDEDRWPSGAGGGYVTKDKEFRQRHLMFTEKKLNGEDDLLLGTYDISIDDDGLMSGYRRIDENENADGVKRYAYRTIEKTGNGWFNNQCYSDLLNPNAVKRLIEVTHEAYKAHLGDEFSKTIKAIFTDEPQTAWQKPAKSAKDHDDISLPWTDEYASKYSEKYGEDILDKLPEVFYESSDGVKSVTRYRYHEFTTELFATAFADQYGSWCRNNNLPMTGHIMNEQLLSNQTFSVGDAMRHYRNFGIPGIDMLLDGHEYVTAKQCQSMVNQNGNEAMLCELDGVTNWDFDFKHHKHHGDWQAALGVTVRVPHLAWYAMNGESKRDYPASISYQAAFADKYHIIEDYFGRVAVALTRGKRSCHVAMLHPIRTMWLNFGTEEHTQQFRQDYDDRYFGPLCKAMITNLVDFDFLSESNLEYQVDKDKISDILSVGCAKYDVVVVPKIETICSSTLQIFDKYIESGGVLIWSGDCPKYVDGILSDKAKAVYDKSQKIGGDICDIVDAVDKYREIDIVENGERCLKYTYQMRNDGSEKWLFIAKAAHETDVDSVNCDDITLKIDGEYHPTIYDAMSGKIFAADFEIRDGKTYIHQKMYADDSLLLRLTKAKINVDEKMVKPCGFDGNTFESAKFSLDEPNVFLLDKAEFKLDDGEFEGKEEILRLDNICRQRLNWKDRSEGSPQPWVINDTTVTNLLTLKYEFESKIITDVILAGENLSTCKIYFNGAEINPAVIGNYVDISIEKIALGALKIGKNEIIIEMPYFIKANPESCYLLGDFGVYCNEKNEPYIDKLPDKLRFADIAKQGLMFYGGDVRYKLNVNVNSGKINIYLPKIRGAMAEILLDGDYAGDIVTAPFSLHIDNVKNGEHEITIRLIGTRVNTFGALHMTWHGDADHNGDYIPIWWGPNAWRTYANSWTYDYVTWEQGVVAPPVIG